MKNIFAIVAACTIFSAFVQSQDYSILQLSTKNKEQKAPEKMTIEVWSDVMCPFCYIGKRRMEEALEQFPHRDSISIVWKSYQLNPNMVTDPDQNINQYLALHKGISVQEAEKMNQYVTEMAGSVGLEYKLDQAIVANSMKAHRFAHYAKSLGKQDEAEELLFKSYFCDGKNTDDIEVLISLAEQIGLEAENMRLMLNSDQFKSEVQEDIKEAEGIGVTGVPFFVFDGKYSLSGAQNSEVFLNALEKSYSEWLER